MRTSFVTISLFGLLTYTGQTLAQEKDPFSRDFDPVRKELVSWDAVRGEWLANSMEAMANNQAVPDRNFPEDFTPAEMFRVLPDATKSRVKNVVATNTNNADSSARQQWTQVNRFVQRPTCTSTIGRSYGDPHLTSFDGANYSFQTVGEFTLVKSGSGHMNVQVRQRNEGNDFSLNSAIAMNVSGDRVCFYASSGPDGNSTTPLRIDGDAIYVESRPYFLDHGGIIRKTGNDYIVTWPTGENVKIDMRGMGNSGFMNLAVEIFPCSDTYVGILGNANGRSSDDFDIGGPGGRQANMNLGVFGGNDAASQAMEKEYLAYLAKDFGRSWRINQMESLFDYGFGQSTAYFTDERFPMVHHTTGDLTDRQRDRSRRECERQGLSGADLNACIYDHGFMNIPPTPRPTIPDNTTGVVIRPVSTPVPNVNPGVRRPAAVKPTEHTDSKNPGTTNGTAQPISTKPIENSGDAGTTKTPATRPVSTTNSQPSVREPEVKQPESTQPVTRTPSSPQPVVKPVEEKPAPVIHIEPKKPSSSNSSGSGSSSSTPKPISTPAPVKTPSTPAPASVPKTSTPTIKTKPE